LEPRLLPSPLRDDRGRPDTPTAEPPLRGVLNSAGGSSGNVPADARRLAAIMFTDLVGFTRLAQRNEEEALRLRREHQALVRPLFAAHGGREVKTLGDGFLVEFPSAVESVRCGVGIQEAVARRNALPSSTERINLRIGIHVGDVVGDGDDIVGDAVNVASRIEPLADPGGICVTGSVYDQVRNKLHLPIEKIGSRELKNVEYPVDIYRIVLSGGAAAPRPPGAETSSSLRLAVLPFASMSPDANDDYFADGLTEELITQTSRIPTLRVVARTSVLRYKGSTKSLREVGQDLGVRLALEGSVRKAGNRVRITVKLADTGSEEHLWSSTYDRPLDDIFAIQDDIAGRIALSISDHVARRHSGTLPAFVPGGAETHDMEAYASFLHGRKLLSEKASGETIQRALTFFEFAVHRDPQFARARVGFAEALLWLGGEGEVPLVESVRRSREELATALGQNERLAEAHSVLSGLQLGDDELEASEREARRAIELNPSLADPYRWLAQIAAGDGKIDETIRLLEAAQRLDPVDVNIVAFLGRAYAYAGRDADALAHWERTKPLAPYRTNAHQAEYYLGIADYARAEESVRELERLRPDNVWTVMYRGILTARMGDPAGARSAIARLERRGQSGELTAFFVGFVHFALGEDEAFAACIEESFRLHALPLMELMYSRLYEPARTNPRILEVLRKQAELRHSAS
jgi:adenylate cyclase